LRAYNLLSHGQSIHSIAADTAAATVKILRNEKRKSDN
jgi:hypothetical protein